MLPPTLSLPSIEISYAPHPEVFDEPLSPFPKAAVVDANDEDAFRPTYLSPPPVMSPTFMARSSPLNPTTQSSGKGINQEKFEMLLKSSREASSTAAAAKRSMDLRREVALKAQRSKQIERRARFLSKIEQPPSPTATQLPATPPESPALFHYTLPSPGLASPLTVFESIFQRPVERQTPDKAQSGWIEQVDFRLSPLDQPQQQTQKQRPRPMPIIQPKFSKMPSLEEITAHLNATGVEVAKARTPRAPLPAFLSRPTSPPSGSAECTPRSVTPIGRLNLPLGPRTSCLPSLPTLDHPRLQGRRSSLPPPPSPSDTLLPKLEVTTTFIPRCSARISGPQLTEANLLALNSRARKAQDMLTTLRRRMPRSTSCTVHGDETDDGSDDDSRRGRRISAPAEMTKGGSRAGFEHPVAALSGGF